MQPISRKSSAKSGFDSAKANFLHPAHTDFVTHWRDGRVVDYSSLENYRTERYRGFESLSLRSEKLKPADFQRAFSLFGKVLV